MMQEQMTEVEELLDYTVQFINEFEELKKGADSGKYKKIVEELMKRRMMIAEAGIDYLRYFKEIFKDDILLHTLVLSVLFFVFDEKALLEQIDELMCSEKMPYDMAIGIRQQLGVMRFRNIDLDITYERKRQLQRVLLARLEKILGESVPYVPYEERNHNCIVVATDRLLSEAHAPTRFVLSLAKCLQEELGYKIIVVADIEQTNTFEMEKYWFCPYIINGKSQNDGIHTLSYEHCDLLVYQQVVDTLHLDEVKSGLQYIASLKPECVWYLGGDSVIRDLYRKMTVLVAMPCTAGYAVSEAQVLASYMLSHSRQEKVAEQYIVLHRQKKMMMIMNLPRQAKGNLYQKKQFGFSEDAFVIAIVGNRLDEEVTNEFQEIMCEIIEREKKISYVIIGNRTRSWREELKDHVLELGFRDDFVEVMNIADLFLNPIRKGGGGGAEVALRCNIPIVTLPDCDVASLVGDAFVCKSIEEVPIAVERYVKNQVFYQNQVEECKKRYKMYDQYDFATELQQGVKTVQQWAEHGEIV